MQKTVLDLKTKTIDVRKSPWTEEENEDWVQVAQQYLSATDSLYQPFFDVLSKALKIRREKKSCQKRYSNLMKKTERS